MIGTFTEKSTIQKMTTAPYDVDNVPNVWIDVVSSYYVSAPKHKGTNQQQTMGGVNSASSYTVQGHYVRDIKSGMRMIIEEMIYEIKSAYDLNGDRSILEMEVAHK